MFGVFSWKRKFFKFEIDLKIGRLQMCTPNWTKKQIKANKSQETYFSCCSIQHIILFWLEIKGKSKIVSINFLPMIASNALFNFLLKFPFYLRELIKIVIGKKLKLQTMNEKTFFSSSWDKCFFGGLKGNFWMQ